MSSAEFYFPGYIRMYISQILEIFVFFPFYSISNEINYDYYFEKWLLFSFLFLFVFFWFQMVYVGLRLFMLYRCFLWMFWLCLLNDEEEEKRKLILYLCLLNNNNFQIFSFLFHISLPLLIYGYICDSNVQIKYYFFIIIANMFACHIFFTQNVYFILFFFSLSRYFSFFSFQNNNKKKIVENWIDFIFNYNSKL